MRKMRLTKTECKQFISGYENILKVFYAELPFNIYSKIIKTTARNKLTALRKYASNG